MYLKWKLYTEDEMVPTQYVTTYRRCHLRIAYMGRSYRSHRVEYTAFVERQGIICTAFFKGRGALHRAKLAAPKLANVMIQHATTHHESKKGTVR